MPIFPMDWVKAGCDMKENKSSWSLTCKTCGEKWRARIVARRPDGSITLEPSVICDRVAPHCAAHAHGRSLASH